MSFLPDASKLSTVYLRVADVVSDPAMKKSTSVFLRLSSARSGEKEEEGSSRARLR